MLSTLTSTKSITPTASTLSTGRKMEVKSKTSKLSSPHSYTILSREKKKHLLSLVSCMVKQEAKETVPRFRGADFPSLIAPPHPGYILVDTKESQLLKTTLSRMFAHKIYQFRLATVLDMSSSGTGIVNSAIQISALQFVSDFTNLTTVFNEFFVVRADVRWQPVGRYQYPLTGVSSTSVANLPIGCADLQHEQAAYTSLSQMTENYAYAHQSTADPFTYSWVNSERPSSTVVTGNISTGAPVQSWANTTDVASYTGTIQFLSQSAPPALPVSQKLGTFLVEWLCLFRVRV